MLANNADQAVDAIFVALREHARPVLEALRDLADDDAIAGWAAIHGIDCPRVIAKAQGLRLQWSRNPQAQQAMRFGSIVSLTAIYTPPSDAEQQYRASLRWPEPQAESARKWRARADTIYRDLRRFRDYSILRQHIVVHRFADGSQEAWLDDATLTRHAGWFVRHRVVGQTLAAIAADHPDVDSIDLSTIRKGIRRVARLAGLSEELSVTR